MNALQTIARSNAVTENEVAEVLKNMIVSSKSQHGAIATNAEMTVVSSIFAKYDLNPFIREGHAFISGGKLQVMIGLDGWIKIANRQPDFDGYEQEEVFDEKGELLAVKTKIYVKGRRFPTPHTEWMKEAFVSTSPAWKKYPFRMLAGKSLGQCVRKAFGVSEVLDDDEASRITGNANQIKDVTPSAPAQEVDLDALRQRMLAAQDISVLREISGAIRSELEASGQWAQYKADIVMMNREAAEAIESRYAADEVVVEFDEDTGEVING